MGHVVDVREGRDQLVARQRPPHLRRSMILRSGCRKRVTTKDTGSRCDTLDLLDESDRPLGQLLEPPSPLVVSRNIVGE